MYAYFNQTDIYSVVATCQLCCLEEEDIYHLVTRCPTFYDIRVATVCLLEADIYSVGADMQ